MWLGCGAPSSASSSATCAGRSGQLRPRGRRRRWVPIPTVWMLLRPSGVGSLDQEDEHAKLPGDEAISESLGDSKDRTRMRHAHKDEGRDDSQAAERVAHLLQVVEAP